MRIYILFFSFCLLLFVAQSADWSQWRGTNRDGIETDSPALAQSWPTFGPLKLWQSERILANSGGGAGSVVIADGKAYIFAYWKTGYNGHKEPCDVIFCLDANTGKTLWKVGFPKSKSYGFGTSGTPCVVNGYCYVTGGRQLYCLDAATGKLHWQTAEIGDELSSSPLVVDNVVVICAGNLFGFDAATGAQIWQQPAAGKDNNSSAACWTKDGINYIITNIGNLCCINPKTGDVIWSVNNVKCCSTPIISGDYCVVGSPVSCYKLSIDKAVKLWNTAINDRGSTPVIYNNYVYTYGGHCSCIDLVTGHSMWDNPCKSEISSPIMADNKIIALSDAGSHLVMFQANPKQYTEYGNIRMLIGNCTSPAISQGKLYLRMHDSINCYDLRQTPEIITPRKPENPADVVTGMRYNYYHNYGSMTVDDSVSRTPTATATISNFKLTPRKNDGHIAFNFTGYIEVAKDGLYTFYTKSDGGSKLYIGDTLVVDNDDPRGSEEIAGTIPLLTGKHLITLRFYRYTEGPGISLDVNYEGPDMAKQIIPDSVLFRRNE